MTTDLYTLPSTRPTFQNLWIRRCFSSVHMGYTCKFSWYYHTPNAIGDLKRSANAFLFLTTLSYSAPL